MGSSGSGKDGEGWGGGGARYPEAEVARWSYARDFLVHGTKRKGTSYRVPHTRGTMKCGPTVFSAVATRSCVAIWF